MAVAPRVHVLHGMAAAIAVLLLTVQPAAPLRAQVRGVVADTAGRPVSGALVELYGSFRRLAAQGTDSLGQFRLLTPVTANGALLVRAIGFAPVRRDLSPSDSVVMVTVQPLPIEVSEVRVNAEPTWCPERDDARARDLWYRAAGHYDIQLSSGLIRAWTMVFGADVPAESLGVMDTTRLHRSLFGEPGTSRRIGWLDFYAQRPAGGQGRRRAGWQYPFLESVQAWHFGDASFPYLNRLAFPPGDWGDTVIAFCSRSGDHPFIRGTLSLSADTTFTGASWEFVTPQPGERAGGRVLFQRTDPHVPGQPLLALVGFFWQKRAHGFYQEWMEFRHWTKCESLESCKAPVPLN
jgi:hypothetical protein